MEPGLSLVGEGLGTGEDWWGTFRIWVLLEGAWPGSPPLVGE